MKYIALFLSLVLSSFFTTANATTGPNDFTIFVTNNSAYKITLGQSERSGQDIYFLTKEVLAKSQQKVGYCKIIGDKADIEFYGRIGDERSYWTTPLIHYYFDGFSSGVFISPQDARVDGHLYHISAYVSDDHSITVVINNF